MKKNNETYEFFYDTMPCKKLKQIPENRQDAPTVFQVNGLFTVNVSRFLKFKKIYMPKILPYEIPPETGLMIDTEFEFQIANYLAESKIKMVK